MKKILFYMLSAVLFTACSQDEIVENADNAQELVAFNLNVNAADDQPGTRAGGTKEFPYWGSEKANMRIILEVYVSGQETPIVRTMSNDATEAVYDEAQGFSFPGVRLPKGQTYVALFWADFGDLFYNADNLRKVEQANLSISLNPNMLANTTTAHVADLMDAYSGQVVFNINTDGQVSMIDNVAVEEPANLENIPVTLTRPLSKVMFCQPLFETQCVDVTDITQWDKGAGVTAACMNQQNVTFQMLYEDEVYTTYDALKKRIITEGGKKRRSSFALNLREWDATVQDQRDLANDRHVYAPTICDYIFMDGTATNTKLTVYPKITWTAATAGDNGLYVNSYITGYIFYDLKQFKKNSVEKFYGPGNTTDGGKVPFVLGVTGAPNKLYRIAQEIQEGDIEDNVTKPLHFFEVTDPSSIPVINGTPGNPIELG